MESNCPRFFGWEAVIFAIVVAAALAGPSQGQTGGSVLLLQQTPRQGGSITPDIGVHQFALNTDVTLTAVAKPGWQFVYWLGDVSAPTTSRTIVHMDAPKIVIAIFERAEYEYAAASGGAPGMAAGGLFASGADYRRGGFGDAGGGNGAPNRRSPSSSPEAPVSVPEPATVVLLALGCLVVVGKLKA